MENITNKQKLFLIAMCCVAVIVVVIYIFTKDDNIEYSDYENIYETNEETTNIVEENIIVHVAGQVENEGVVELNQNARVIDAIDASGGLTSEANTSSINLAQVVKDGQKIYIPSDEEIESENNFSESGDTSIINENKGSDLININTATQTELETLSGIGPSTALKIINYRTENGDFKNIEDIKNVPGIGDAKFNSIKDFICIN